MSSQAYKEWKSEEWKPPKRSLKDTIAALGKLKAEKFGAGEEPEVDVTQGKDASTEPPHLEVSKRQSSVCDVPFEEENDEQDQGHDECVRLEEDDEGVDDIVRIGKDDGWDDKSVGNEGEDDELRCDSEAGLWEAPDPDGPFEPLVLWPPAGEGTSNGVEKERVVQVPASINARLFEHQRAGVCFLYNLYRKNQGGILGDDMGLGKTIQTIAFLAAILGKESEEEGSLISSLPLNRKQRCEKVVLIMCPKSVVQNWEQEFKIWGDFQVGTYLGQQRESVLARVVAKELEVVLTSPDTFRIYGTELCTIKWDCVVIDEAHRLKDAKSKLHQMCSRLTTARRYGLTGTVMQNKYTELFNVFDWATPGCLGSRNHFKEHYSKPIADGQRISAPQRFVIIANDRKRHLKTVLGRYHLRRTKEETIGHMMKGKEDTVVFCRMSDVQKRVYKRVLQSPDFEALLRKDDPCSCGGPLKSGECCFRTVPNGVIWRSLEKHKEDPVSGCRFCPNCLILPCLTKLRLLSNHLELIKPNTKDSQEKQDKGQEFAEMAFGEDADALGGIQQEQSFLSLSDSRHCGKMFALEALLKAWISQKDKILLFSNSVRLLDILEKMLIRHGFSYSRLDGSTHGRQALVDEFNHSPSNQIFLISTLAGSLGLNLTSANRVVIFDPGWNPSHDLQAQDRSFRFGQNRHVTVYRLLAAGTLEELVYTRQIYKQQLFNIAMSEEPEKRYFEGVQGDKRHHGELFGMKNLFRDISENPFAEDIIENHEERLVRFQTMAEQEKMPGRDVLLPYAGAEYAEDGLDYQGSLTCNEAQDFAASHPAASHPASEDTNEDETGKEERTQRMIHKGLMNAGVVYSHRNEDVVNFGPPTQRVPRRAPEHTSNAKGAATEQKRKATRNGARKMEKRRASGGIQRNGLDRSNKALEKTCDTISPAARKEVASDVKRASFVKLAEARGMTVSDFSKWILSLGPEERAKVKIGK